MKYNTRNEVDHLDAEYRKIFDNASSKSHVKTEFVVTDDILKPSDLDRLMSSIPSPSAFVMNLKTLQVYRKQNRDQIFLGNLRHKGRLEYMPDYNGVPIITHDEVPENFVYVMSIDSSGTVRLADDIARLEIRK